MKSERFDIHQHITNQIIAAIEGDVPLLVEARSSKPTPRL